MSSSTRQFSEPPKALSPLFILVWFTFMLGGSLYISWLHFLAFYPHETSHSVTPLSPEIIQGFGGHPGVVHVGLIVESFREFKINDNKFVFNGTLWFIFDPSLTSLETIEGVTIENGKFLEKSKPHVRLVGDQLFVRYAVQVEFQCNLNFSDFPDDDHKLYIVFSHPTISPNTLIFSSTRPDLVVHDDMSKYGWTAIDYTVSPGFNISHVKSSALDLQFAHPVVVFSIDYRHSSMRDLLSILLPLLVMMGTLLFSFALDRERLATERTKIVIQTIAATIAFRFVIDIMSPKVGYLMTSDKFFFFFLFLFLIMFIVSLNSQRLTAWIERIIVVSMSTTVVIGTVLIWMS